ncbi:RNA polymerase sigma factor [Chitinophaga pinensis]|uniref:RNA polymerase sigma-70 factor n=1 Tax=Chitinophaga pinensis TaxID=79329 RepID=A0A5C6LJG2_9BACT|nr:RNA polymerase sigma-70 factor [Chitinophaga pinensis]TWV91100.1 RNA polymerase sigma-70 factor [Chitinophaga pinensis]
MSSAQSYEEKELLAAIAKGDTKAFAAVFKKYRMPVFMHTLSIIKSPERAEEITQDVFLKIWHYREGLDQLTSFENYLFIVTRNYTISELRKKFIPTDPEVDQAYSWTPEKQLQFKELSSRLHEIINRLPPRRKQVFVMSRFENKTHQQIADELKISSGTVNQQLMAALSFIRAELAGFPELCLLLVSLGFIFF